jgi:uncharacterized protein
MASIAERLLNDLRSAMRDRDKPRRELMQFTRSEIHNEEIKQGRELTDAEIIDVIRRQIKQRRESSEQFEAGRRQDLVDIEQAHIAILQEYLPAQLDMDELERIAGDLATDLELAGPGDMGRLMTPLREAVGARAEGRDIAEAARTVLTRREQEQQQQT